MKSHQTLTISLSAIHLRMSVYKSQKSLSLLTMNLKERFLLSKTKTKVKICTKMFTRTLELSINKMHQGLQRMKFIQNWLVLSSYLKHLKIKFTVLSVELVHLREETGRINLTTFVLISSSRTKNWVDRCITLNSPRGYLMIKTIQEINHSFNRMTNLLCNVLQM